MSSNRHVAKPKQRGGFVRKTVTIPGEITPFAEERTASPEHAGNFSSYVRTLILKDKAEQEKLKAAA